jgi:glutaredoxin
VSAELLLYTRQDCCLCDEMKAVVHEAARGFALGVAEVDVDSAPELREKYGSEVPVLFINGRKAFKYRVTVEELKQRLKA